MYELMVTDTFNGVTTHSTFRTYEEAVSYAAQYFDDSYDFMSLRLHDSKHNVTWCFR